MDKVSKFDIKDFAFSETISKKFNVNPLQKKGSRFLMTGFGEVGFPIIDIIAGDYNKIVSNTHLYPPPIGTIHHRSIIARYYTSRGLKCTWEQIILTPGSKILLYQLFQLIDGDIVVPVPAWPTYFTQAHILGKNIIKVNCEKSEHIPNAKLISDNVFRARDNGLSPKILLLNTPNNPTGAIIPANELKKICSLAEKESLLIISDEVYSNILRKDTEFCSPYLFTPENTVVINSISKMFGAGGWRLGYGLLPVGKLGIELSRSILSLATSTWTSCTGASQELIPVLFSNKNFVKKAILIANEIHDFVIAIISKQLNRFPVNYVFPKGAFYIYLSFEKSKDLLMKKYNIKTGLELENSLNYFGIPAIGAASFGEDNTVLSVRISFAQMLNFNQNEFHELTKIGKTKRQQIYGIKSTSSDLWIFLERLNIFFGL